MRAIKRIIIGPKSIPQGIMATVVKIHYGPVNEFSEELTEGQVRTFRVLPDGAFWQMPTNYVIPHVYRTKSVVRYYSSRDKWIEDGVEVQEHVHALTT